MFKTLYKTVDEILDVGIDWSNFLENAVTITDSVWTSPNLTIARQAFVGNVTSCTVAGGDEDSFVVLTNTITTSDGIVAQRSLQVRVVKQKFI